MNIPKNKELEDKEYNYPVINNIPTGQVGTVCKSLNFGDCVVVEWKNNKKILIQFLDSGSKYYVQHSALKKGLVGDESQLVNAKLLKKDLALIAKAEAKKEELSKEIRKAKTRIANRRKTTEARVANMNTVKEVVNAVNEG